MAKDKKQKDENKEVEEWKNKYLRALADYQNLEKRTALQGQEVRKRANQELLLKFLDSLDGLDRAEIFVKDEGLKLIKADFIKILHSEGVAEMNLLGQEFDPYLAECVEVVPGTKDNIIVEILRKGYKLHDEVLRVARVKVEKKVV